MNPKPFTTYLQAALTEWTCQRIELWRAGNRGGSTLLRSLEVKEPVSLANNADKLADVVGQLAELAQQDADGWNSPCRYYLQAKFAELEAPQTKSPVVRVHPRDGGISDDDDGGENPATVSGHLAQAYRHNEVLARQQAMLVQMFQQTFAETNKQQAEELQQLRQERTENLRATEELLSLAHERELELAKDARREKVLDAALTEGRKMLPAVVSKMTRVPLTDARHHPGIIALARVIKDIANDGDKMARVASAVGGGTFTALVEAIGSFDLDALEATDNDDSEDTSGGNGTGNPFTN